MVLGVLCGSRVVLGGSVVVLDVSSGGSRWLQSGSGWF